jgi:hypothetical protein
MDQRGKGLFVAPLNKFLEQLPIAGIGAAGRTEQAPDPLQRSG